ncbi:acyltransferase family protein [Chitinibacteraceae bacterium HSL-7]
MTLALRHDVALLDPLRGWAAVLVFLHHAAILGGGPRWLADQIGHEAVNAFMLASGFLIYLQVANSKTYEALATREGIRRFYLRRYFRIAPLYYIALLVALLAAPLLGGAREAIAQAVPGSATTMSRYFIEAPWTSALVHITFVFGALPQYAYSTPLPDWSLGLEMQFYLLFPLLYLLVRRHFLAGLIALCTVALLCTAALAQAGIYYPMPTLLPLKLHNFAAGMALAWLYLNAQGQWRQALPTLLCTMFFLLLGNGTPAMALLLAALWWLMCTTTGPRLAPLQQAIHRWAARPLSKLLAELSYSIYLLHLLLMLPFFAWLTNRGPLDALHWLLATLVLFALVLPMAFAAYYYIELPGIRLGKALIARKAS